MAFERNVFVNCPFDDGYRPILRALLFTVSFLGFQPRIALESCDSGRSRIEKIVALVRESKYAILELRSEFDVSRELAAWQVINGPAYHTLDQRDQQLLRRWTADTRYSTLF